MASSQETERDSTHLLTRQEVTETEEELSDYEHKVSTNRVSDSYVAHSQGVQSESTQDSSPQANPRASTNALILQGSSNTIGDSNVAHSAHSESTQNSPPPANPPVKNPAGKYALGASIICLFLGFDIGIMNDAVALANKGNRIIDGQLEVAEAIMHVLSLVGAAAGGRTADKIGRLPTIMWTGIFFSGGSLIMGFFSKGSLLLVGRAFIQLGAGFAPTVAATYIAELSPGFSRGCLASLPEVSINLGTLLGYSFNYTTVKLHPNLGRVAILSLGVITPVLLAIGISVMPETPRWLVMQGRIHDAKLVLAETSASQEEVDRRLADIMVALNIPIVPNREIAQINVQSSGEGVWRDLVCPTTPLVFHMVACACGLHVLQQACGFDIVILFSASIIKKAGVISHNEKHIFAIKFRIVKTVFFLIATFLLDRVGRLRLLQISIAGMIGSLATLGTCLILIDHGDTEPEWPVAMCVPSLYFYVAFYSVGMGPIALVYSTEVFPLRLRAQGLALAVAMNQVTGAILAATFKQLYEAITLGGAIFFFVGMAMIGFLSVYLVLPETRGKTLEEMYKSFGTLFMWKRPETAREIEMHEQ